MRSGPIRYRLGVLAGASMAGAVIAVSPARACGGPGDLPCQLDRLVYCGSPVLCVRSKQFCESFSPRLDQSGRCAALPANDIPPPQPVNYGGVTTGYVVRVDLTKVAPIVPHTSDPPLCPAGNLASVVHNLPQMPTDNWVNDPAYAPRLAVNGSFFEVRSGTTPWTEKCAHIFAYTLSNGEEVRPPELIETSNGETLTPATLLFYGPQASVPAEIKLYNTFHVPPPGVTDAISGAQLVNGGIYAGDGIAGPLAGQAHQRTAVGLTQDKTTLIVVTVSGTDASGRIALQPLADYLISLGAWDAINLDGGGSAQLYYRGNDGKEILSVPSDTPTGYDGPGRFYRPVGNFLGFK
jgi:hypothetical protein